VWILYQYLLEDWSSRLANTNKHIKLTLVAWWKLKKQAKLTLLPHLVHKGLVAWPIICTELLKELCGLFRSILQKDAAILLHVGLGLQFHRNVRTD
jgi:hypothetical protein